MPPVCTSSAPRRRCPRSRRTTCRRAIRRARRPPTARPRATPAEYHRHHRARSRCIPERNRDQHLFEQQRRDRSAGPSSASSDVARSATSGGYDERSTLMPMPRMMAWPGVPIAMPSARMPASLRRPTITSFGHFSSVHEARRRARWPSCTRDAGRERHQREQTRSASGSMRRAKDEGEIQPRARRRAPRAPATAAPGRLLVGDDDHALGGAGRRWPSAATSIVDVTIGWHVSARERRAAPVTSGSALGTCRTVQWLELEAQIGGAHRVRERADRHEVRAGGRDLRNPLERHAAGDLDDARPAAARDGFAQIAGREIVDEDARRAGRQRLIELVERLDFDFDRAVPRRPRARVRARARCRRRAACGCP